MRKVHIKKASAEGSEETNWCCLNALCWTTYIKTPLPRAKYFDSSLFRNINDKEKSVKSHICLFYPPTDKSVRLADIWSFRQNLKNVRHKLLLFVWKHLSQCCFCYHPVLQTSSLPLCACVFLYNNQARVHHGRVELAHLGGEHPGLPHRRRLCLVCVGNVFHRPRTHHCLLRDTVLLLPGWKSVFKYLI